LNLDKAVRPRVRVISASERTYSVTGSKGDVYTVRFAVAGGHKLGECDCKAGRADRFVTTWYQPRKSI